MAEQKQEQEGSGRREQEVSCSSLMKGVRHLFDNGITRLPDRYAIARRRRCPACHRRPTPPLLSCMPPPP
jgi:hypothetical protein